MVGELHLDEMTNDWAVMWMLIIFIVMNVILMNLLIAIMSNTCKPPSARNAVSDRRACGSGVRGPLPAPSLRRPRGCVAAPPIEGVPTHDTP